MWCATGTHRLVYQHPPPPPRKRGEKIAADHYRNDKLGISERAAAKVGLRLFCAHFCARFSFPFKHALRKL